MTTYLVTGAAGSIGTAVVAALRERGDVVGATDLVLDSEHVDSVCDVTLLEDVRGAVALYEPDVIIHLAGAKHAPVGEESPGQALQVNALGTQNAVIAALEGGAKLVTASTCKACDPETAYGASKLIAERLTLNSGGVVARFHNVVETQGNVFELWSKIPAREPLPVAMLCRRYFISLDAAVELVLWCADQGEAGARYMTDPGALMSMAEVAQRSAPGRDVRMVPPRRGDRLVEPAHAESETTEPVQGTRLFRVFSPHDERRAS